MTLKLEVGKRYVLKSGGKTGPLQVSSRHNRYEFPWWDDLNDRSYKNDGSYLYSEPSPFDIASEYVEPTDTLKPTFTVAGDAKPKPKATHSIAAEAENIVNGARRSTYGEAEDNFERIARFWNAYMKNTGREVEITAADVSPMMRLLKEARLCETPDHRDSFVDLIGYALTGARVNKVE